MFNCPELTDDMFKSKYSFFIVVIIAIGFLFTLLVNVKNIIVEKETKMKVRLTKIQQVDFFAHLKI
jgi:hypothetical protein